jgi:hypothetical protein
MSFEHTVKKLAVGDTLSIPDGDVLAETHLETDSRGGFVIVAHILRRTDGVAFAAANPTKEIGQ